MSDYKVPPVGLKPRFLVEEERLQDIFEAMMRYRQAHKTIPQEWLDEFNELMKRGK